MSLDPEVTLPFDPIVRTIAPGMGQAVAERTILRMKPDGTREVWGDVAHRVALGNASLVADCSAYPASNEFLNLRKHIAKATTLMSGRHLQHGDENQAMRNMEVFTNCATSPTSFMLFYLLLNGSGVGRCYDDDMMLVDWDYAPNLRCVIDSAHLDFKLDTHESLRDAQHKYGFGPNVMWHRVADSREGWAKALEIWEVAAFEKVHANKLLILDFSDVRRSGLPIAGMQSRPTSGPAPLMGAFLKAASLKGAGLSRWLQAMYIDHYFAECVLVGGARRAARMSTKHWSDETIFDFIKIKRPIEFANRTMEEIKTTPNGGPFLWSSNNSVTVDERFWELLESDNQVLSLHAKKVFEAVCEAAYGDGTGEPGFINSHKLIQKDTGWEELMKGEYVGSKRYEINDETSVYFAKLAKRAKKKNMHTITNPCVPGDTAILTSEGYVNIEDVVGKPVEVWNGKEWSTVTPFSTGFNEMLKITLSNGVSIRCTPWHNFVLAGENYTDNKEYRKKAADLKIGNKLFKFSMPVVAQGENYPIDAYSQGFYSGDGNTGLEHSWLYEPKYVCSQRLIGAVGKEQSSAARKTWKHGPMLGKCFVPIRGTLAYCLNWLAGISDADGTIHNDVEGGQSLTISSVNEAFLLDIRLMLSRLGVQAHVGMMHEAGKRHMPDGKGSHALFEFQKCYRLVICGFDLYKLHELGLSFSRLEYKAAKPQRSAARFVKIVRIEEEEECETFCFTENKNHTGTFEGVVLGQCGEIALNLLGGFCVIADLVPYHCDSIEEFEDSARVTTRALIRVNTMDSVFNREVKRTNRIGVGMTGVHEYAWKFFGFGFRDLLDEEKAQPFWQSLARVSNAVRDEAATYSGMLGLPVPHTLTTMKPAGTTSKLFLLTEGGHLPTMREYIRWVQFRHDDPLVKTYKEAGYPTRELETYSGTIIVGFPTAPTITTLGMGDKLVTAAEASPEEQFQWLKLLEKYWINGGNEAAQDGNQVSYTLKYKPSDTSYSHFREMLAKHQRDIRCCTVMPQEDTSNYEYQPEQGVTHLEYEGVVSRIRRQEEEDVGAEHVGCESGACPVDFNRNAKEAVAA